MLYINERFNSLVHFISNTISTQINPINHHPSTINYQSQPTPIPPPAPSQSPSKAFPPLSLELSEASLRILNKRETLSRSISLILRKWEQMTILLRRWVQQRETSPFTAVHIKMSI
ncbi:MAG: hypothetical protein H7Z76_03970 [Methylotenera sp.]|nr:hypothetical protein [Flavobacterium sp.]